MTTPTTDTRVRPLPLGASDFYLEECHSEVVPRLYQGGTAQGDDDWPYAVPELRCAPVGPDEADAVVTLWHWSSPCAPGVEELRACFDDSSKVPDLAEVRAAARWAYDRWLRGDRVLVRCQMGVNRSGLVMGVILTLMGLTPDEAIARIRATRSTYALFNRTFERLLRRTPVEYWRG